MSLINDLFARPLEPGYYEAAERRQAAGRRSPAGLSKSSPVLLVGLLMLGLVLTTSSMQVQRNAGVVSAERTSLIERIDRETDHVSRLESQLSTLETELTELRSTLITSNSVGQELRETLRTTQTVVGNSRVRGPGIVIEMNDAQDAEVTEDEEEAAKKRVLDLDLRMVVNGLWAAGAEAISVNGERLTSLTAIRSVQRVIRVNYQPLSPPYVVEAVGDPRTLGADFDNGPGGQWLRDIALEEGIRFEVTTAESLNLPAGAATLHEATPEEVS